MSKASGYRVKAEECDRQAADASDPAVKNHYSTLANAWRVMAEQAEQVHARSSNQSISQTKG